MRKQGKSGKKPTNSKEFSPCFEPTTKRVIEPTSFRSFLSISKETVKKEEPVELDPIEIVEEDYNDISLNNTVESFLDEESDCIPMSIGSESTNCQSSETAKEELNEDVSEQDQDCFEISEERLNQLKNGDCVLVISDQKESDPSKSFRFSCFKAVKNNNDPGNSWLVDEEGVFLDDECKFILKPRTFLLDALNERKKEPACLCLNPKIIDVDQIQPKINKRHDNRTNFVQLEGQENPFVDLEDGEQESPLVVDDMEVDGVTFKFEFTKKEESIKEERPKEENGMKKEEFLEKNEDLDAKESTTTPSMKEIGLPMQNPKRKKPSLKRGAA